MEVVGSFLTRNLCANSMQSTITYLGSDFSNNKGYVDLARGLSIVNRRHYDMVNGKGIAQTFVCEVEFIGSSSEARACAIYTAPETWSVKNAVKKVHEIRKASFLKAGQKVSDFPAYARNLKFFLDKGHRVSAAAGSGVLRPGLYNPTTGTADTPSVTTSTNSPWQYTRLAHTTGTEGDSFATQSGDDYELTLMGDHDFQAGSGTYQTYDSVAMVEAYLEHRRNKTVNISASTGDVPQEEPNPLTLLMNDAVSGQEKAEIISESHAVDPPYQTSSGTFAGTDALDLHLASFLNTSTTYIRDRDVIRIPAGLALLVGSASNPGSVRFHVMRVEDMEQ